MSSGGTDGREFRSAGIPTYGAGSLVQVGRGFWPETQIADVLHAMDRRLAGPTAPPDGLFLMRVTYNPCPT